MGPVMTCLPAIMISTVYCFWQHYHEYRASRKDRKLRERVTHLLWTMAQRV